MRRTSWVVGCACLMACGGASLQASPSPAVSADKVSREEPPPPEAMEVASPAPRRSAASPPSDEASVVADGAAVAEALTTLGYVGGDLDGLKDRIGEAEVGFGGLGTRGSGMGGGGGGEGVIGGLGSAGKGGMKREGKLVRDGDVAARQVLRSPLRAGATDDNADLGAFVRFLDEWSRDGSVRVVMQPMATSRAELLTVRADDGRPLPGASVELIARDGRVVGRVGTYGDGRAPFYPDQWPDAVSARVAGTPYLVDLAGSATVLDTTLAAPSHRVKLDVAIVLDTTGSMADELDRIQATLAGVLQQVDQLGQDVDLRLGGVLYRDRGDAYLTQRMPFTADRAAFGATLMAASADGGGDTPEALGPALSETVHTLAWRDGAAHVAFLIADAEPHRDAGAHSYDQGAFDAVGRGIRVHTVAASGLSPAGTVVMRQVAQATRGEFIYIEYGSAAATAASHGIASPEQVGSNNLDAILFERIKREISAWRKG